MMRIKLPILIMFILFIFSAYAQKNIQIVSGVWSGFIGTTEPINLTIEKGSELAMLDALDKLGTFLISEEILTRFNNETSYNQFVRSSRSAFIKQVGEKRISFPINYSDDSPGKIRISADYIIDNDELKEFIINNIQNATQEYFESFINTILKNYNTINDFQDNVSQYNSDDIKRLIEKRRKITQLYVMTSANAKNIPSKMDRTIDNNIRTIEKQFNEIDTWLKQSLHYPKTILTDCSVTKGDIKSIRKKKYSFQMGIQFAFDNRGIGQINDVLKNINIVEIEDFVSLKDFDEPFKKNIRRIERKHKDVFFSKKRNGRYAIFKKSNDAILYAYVLDDEMNRIKRIKIGNFSDVNANNMEKLFKASFNLNRKQFKNAKYIEFFSEYRAYYDQKFGFKTKMMQTTLFGDKTMSLYSLKLTPFLNYYNLHSQYQRLRFGLSVDVPLFHEKKDKIALFVNPVISYDFGKVHLRSRKGWSAGASVIPSLYGLINSSDIPTITEYEVKKYTHEILVHLRFNSFEAGVGFLWNSHTFYEYQGAVPHRRRSNKSGIIGYLALSLN